MSCCVLDSESGSAFKVYHVYGPRAEYSNGATISPACREDFWECPYMGRYEATAHPIRNYFPDAKSFLEVGCGTGFVLAGIHEKFPAMRLAGSEIFADGLAIAKKRVPNSELYQMDARGISFEDEFDVVGAFDVLEHVIEDEDVLVQIFNAAQPGGGLLITVPQHRFLWSASDQYAMHRRRYNRAELRR